MPGQRYATLLINCIAPQDGDELQLWLGGAYETFTATTDIAGVGPLQFYAGPPPIGARDTAAYALLDALLTRLAARGLSSSYNVTLTPIQAFSYFELRITATAYDQALDFEPALISDPTYGAFYEQERLATIRPVVIVPTPTIATCFGSATGSIALAVSNGTAGVYTYSWADGPTTRDRAGLVAGTYTVTATDASGASTTLAVVVGQNSRIDVVINKVGQNLLLQVSGGTGPYTYAWADGPTTRDRTNVPGGYTYTVTVTDALGCSTTVSTTLESFRYYFSGNIIPLTVDAGDAYRADPSTKPGLVFRCEVFVETEYLSGTYVAVGPVQEQPADTDGRTTFEVQELLEGYVTDHLPAPGQDYVGLAAGMFCRFYLRYHEHTDAGAGPLVTLAHNYLVRGGLSFVEAGVGTWFSGYQEQRLPFLTWEPVRKPVLPDQPEYLYFMVPTDSMSELRYCVRALLLDGATHTFVHTTHPGMQRYQVYCLPAGFAQLQLSALELDGARVHSYEVYVLDQADTPVSERRTFVVDRAVAPTRRYFLYANSLGGTNTLCCRGRAEFTLATKTTSSETDTAAGYDPLRGQVAIDRKTGTPLLKCYAGARSAEQQLADQDFVLSERVLLLLHGRYYAGVAKDRTFTPLDEDETRRVLQFDYELPRERFYTPAL